jgi:uncharacterized protein (TIGR03437 family)
VNGEPAPILYASYGQVNAILPYSPLQYSRPNIQVESQGVAGNALTTLIWNSGIALFRTPGVNLGGLHYGQVAALNEDGTVNSLSNPAKKGSRVVLFGTGGGITTPASTAGAVTSGVRWLVNPVSASVGHGSITIPLVVEYAGGAPGLVAGATQINVKLPDIIPPLTGVPPGVLPISVVAANGTYYPGYTMIAVAP